MVRNHSDGVSLVSPWLIEYRTYKILCNMWCVMCDAWCVMFQIWFFVRSWLYESRGDQKHPIWVISDLFNDIPKLIPGGSRMYTISCKASYTPFSKMSPHTTIFSWLTGSKINFCGAFLNCVVFIKKTLISCRPELRDYSCFVK